MFKIFKRKRRFSLTFAVSQTVYSLFPTFTMEGDGVPKTYTDFHIGYAITMRGPISRDAILQTVKEYKQKCTDENEKKIIEFLLEHAVLIAWNEID